MEMFITSRHDREGAANLKPNRTAVAEMLILVLPAAQYSKRRPFLGSCRIFDRRP